MNKQTVLVVDDIPNNISIMLEVLKDDYAVLVANSGSKALEIARGEHKPDIIVLDIMMPGMNGYQVIEQLKKEELTNHIPVIFVTAINETISEDKGLSMGAVDYITKPYNPELVKKRIKNQLELKQYQDSLKKKVEEKTSEIYDTQLQIIHKLGRAAEYKDNETGLHTIRMSKYCYLIAKEYGVSEDEAKLIETAALMHDVGKIGIADVILLKSGKLTEEEYDIIKTHCAIGVEIIGKHPSKLLQAALVLAYEHHEKWDGNGYPRAIKGEQIHIYARIAAVADVFDALLSKRAYKTAWIFEEAYQLINEESGKHFDPKVVEAFNRTITSIKKIMIEFKD